MTQALLFPHGWARVEKTPPGWAVASDGLTVLTSSPDGIQRLKVTPGSDTSLATIAQATQGPQTKGKGQVTPTGR